MQVREARMERGGKHPVAHKSDSFLDTKAGPILYIIISVVGLAFLLWFANIK